MKKALVLLIALMMLTANVGSVLADSVRIKEGSNPNVRSQPSTEGSVLGHALSGQTYELLEASQNWYKIQLNDAVQGWISAGMVDQTIASQETPRQTAGNTETGYADAASVADPSDASDANKTIHIDRISSHFELVEEQLPGSPSPSLFDINGVSVHIHAIKAAKVLDEPVIELSFKFHLGNGYVSVSQSITNVKINGVPFLCDENHATAGDGDVVVFTLKSNEGGIPSIKDIDSVEFGMTVRGLSDDPEPMVLIVDRADISVDTNETARFHLEEASSSMLTTEQQLPESFSPPFFDIDGVSAYVFYIHAATVLDKPVIELWIMFHLESKYGTVLPQITDVKINGKPFLCDNNDYGAEDGDFVVFTLRAEDQTPPAAEDIHTVEFGMTVTGSVDQGFNVFQLDHVTITVDPDMERGEGRAVSYAGKGMALHSDGSLAFKFGDEYDEVANFSEGRARVARALNEEDFLYGVIDTEGNLIAPVEYERAMATFSDGLYAVCKDKKWFYLDRNGQVAIEPQCDFVYAFSDGFARIFQGTLNPRGTPVQGFYSFIDTEGNPVEALGRWEKANYFQEGAAAVQKDGLWGLIGLDGRWIVEPMWDSVESYKNGYAALCKDGKYTYADKTGHIYSEPIFDEPLVFSKEGVALAKMNGQYRLIDTQMNILNDMQRFSYAYWYASAGYAAAYSGSLDQYGYPAHISNQLQNVTLIDAAGNEILTFETADINVVITVPGRGIIHNQYNDNGVGHYGMIDFEGNTLIPFEYANLDETDDPDLYMGYRVTNTTDENGRWKQQVTLIFYRLSQGEIAWIDFDEEIYGTYRRSANFHDGIRVFNPETR